MNMFDTFEMTSLKILNKNALEITKIKLVHIPDFQPDLWGDIVAKDTLPYTTDLGQ